MDDDRTTAEAIQDLLTSKVGQAMIRPGHEQAFAGELEAFIHGLNLDRWEGDPDYMDEALRDFYERQMAPDTGHLHALDAWDWVPGVWDVVEGVVQANMAARYSAEVARGSREDLRAPVEEAQEAPEPSPMEALAARVQAFVQAVKEFVRGRELEDPIQEHGAER